MIKSSSRGVCVFVCFSVLLHLLSFRRPTGLPAHDKVAPPSCHRIKAVFEVHSELQESVRSEVTARLTWPSLLNFTHRLVFPPTNANSSSVSSESPASNPCRPNPFSREGRRAVT